jgi:hypothetical protein
MPHTFYLIRADDTIMNGYLTYAVHIYQNQQVVVLQINSVLWSDSSSNSLDDLISAKSVVVSNRWADSIL